MLRCERPGLFWAEFRAAGAASRIGEYDVAVDMLGRCVDRCPSNPLLRLRLASALCHAERSATRPPEVTPFGDALAQCDKAVSLAPDYAAAYRIRAWIRKESGWSDGVQADLNRHKVLTIRVGQAPALGLDLA